MELDTNEYRKMKVQRVHFLTKLSSFQSHTDAVLLIREIHCSCTYRTSLECKPSFSPDSLMFSESLLVIVV